MVHFQEPAQAKATQELRLDPRLLDTHSCLLARGSPRTVILGTKVSTIVARFDPGVVIFLFHGRNSGQQKDKREKGQCPESANWLQVRAQIASPRLKSC
jgi:hypothetical protein